MRAKIHYIASILLIATALQVASILCLLYFFSPTILDPSVVSNTIFQNACRMPVYGSPIIVRGSHKPQVLILGTSNTVLGIRTQKLQPLLSNTIIHNIAMGGQRFRSFDDLITLLYRQTPLNQQRNYIFVIGISYPLIADMKARWDDATCVEEELLRFGVFKDTENGIVPRVAESKISTSLQVVWPFLLPKAVYNILIRGILAERFWLGLVDPVDFSDEETNTMTFTPEQNKRLIEYYHSQTIDWDGKYTFKQLTHTIDRVTAAGGQVVIVDLPSAIWLQDATPLYAAYEKLKKPFLEALEKRRNVHYVSIQDGFSDDDFYDGIHPRERVAERIAQRIAPTIQQAYTELENDRKK